MIKTRKQVKQFNKVISALELNSDDLVALLEAVNVFEQCLCTDISDYVMESSDSWILLKCKLAVMLEFSRD